MRTRVRWIFIRFWRKGALDYRTYWTQSVVYTPTNPILPIPESSES